MTRGARHCIEHADKVLFLVAEAVTAKWLEDLNPTAESLSVFYDPAKPRLESYHAMVDRILSFVREGKDVCVVSYGHPGVFAYPMHAAIARAREEGYRATMLPGISALDCLLADLGVDPGYGCQIFDATDFLVRRRNFDIATPLVLLQIAITGDPGFKEVYGTAGLRLLVEVLAEHYGADHNVIVYEAAEHPVVDPVVLHTRLDNVPDAGVTSASTLFVPAKSQPPVDDKMLQRVRETRIM